MKRILFGVVLGLAGVLLFFYINKKTKEKEQVDFQSQLIAKEIKNVSKLVVTEGNFSEIISYSDNNNLLGEIFQLNKKAIVVVNADVTIAYDLSKIDYQIDESSKTLKIISIPKEEIKVNPDLDYYDIQAGYLNPFQANDYNEVKKIVKKELLKKINQSDMKANAKNRLISELAKFYILTNSMGWTLTYNENTIESQEEWELLKFLD